MSKLKIFVGEERKAWTYGQAVVAARTAEEAQKVFEFDRAPCRSPQLQWEEELQLSTNLETPTVILDSTGWRQD